METGNADSWEEIYRTRFADILPPPSWPTNIKPLSINGLSLFGVDPSTGEAYWDGKKLQTVARLGRLERVLAVAVAVSSLLIAGIEVGRFGNEAGFWQYGRAAELPLVGEHNGSERAQ